MKNLDEYIFERDIPSASCQFDLAPELQPPVRPTRSKPGSRRLLVGLFVVYLVLLCWIILWRLEVPYVGSGSQRALKLVPFVATSAYGASAASEIIANLLLFVPFGLYLGTLRPDWQWWRIIGISAGVSLSLEVAQYVFALGSTDTTDIIVNTAGALVGFGLITVVRSRLGTRTHRTVVRYCIAGTLIAVLGCVLFFLSPIRYGGPDVASPNMGEPPSQGRER